MTAVIVNLIAIAAFGYALFRDRNKAVRSIQVAFKMLLGILPMLLIIILLIGLLFGFVSEDELRRFIGSQTGFPGILIAAATGAVLHIPAILAFPLSASLLARGASISIVAAFITSLTMIGVVTLPLEIKELGPRFALLRNGASLAAALIISLLMGALL